MLPSFLITFREVIEASLIVATILGILVKFNNKKAVKTVFWGGVSAIAVSVLLLFIGSLIGLKVQKVYSGEIEEIVEGLLMILSSIFITWSVFFLHNYFGKHKTQLIKKINKTIERDNPKGLFGLVFFAVFREGFEIVLFLTTIYFSSSPLDIFKGFILGTVLAVMVSFGLFIGTLKLPVFYAFRVTSLLLILFAAGLLSKGVNEFAGFFVSYKINLLQISIFFLYVLFMGYRVFFREEVNKLSQR